MSCSLFARHSLETIFVLVHVRGEHRDPAGIHTYDLRIKPTLAAGEDCVLVSTTGMSGK